MAVRYKDGTVKYVGLVLGIESHNGPSWGCDATYAKVWNTETNDWGLVAIRKVYGDWGNEHIVSEVDSYDVDAPPEIMHAYQVQEQERAAKASEIRWLERNLADALKVSRGKCVRVVKGRKVAIGTEGVVKWYGIDNYGGSRIGLKVEGNDKLVYTAEENVEVVLPSWWTPVDYAGDAGA